MNKLDDVKCDEYLQSVDILCLCETWLTPNIVTPNIIDSHTNIIRCDRTSGSKGGGLMITCKPNVSYLLINVDLPDNGVEEDL